MKKRKVSLIIMAIAMAICMVLFVFLPACKKDKDEDEVFVEHMHEYEASWDWGADYTTCDVTLTCKSTDGECDMPTVTDKADVTSVETTAATCEGDGVKTYTATYEYREERYTDTMYETLPALGHKWPATDDAENIDWQWGSRTEKNVSLVVTCERCKATLLDMEVEYETDDDNDGVLSAKCELDNDITYTSEYKTSNDPTEHTHHYEAVEWSWSEDYSSCEVTLTCGGIVGECPESEKTITKYATVISEETVPATCEEVGDMTYTATLEYGGHTYTNTKTETIEALGHEYKEENAEWIWSVDSEGKASATVTIACSRDSSHAVWSETQTSIEIGDDGLYHASIVGPDGITQLTDSYGLIEIQTKYKIDFSDPETYGWIGTPTSTGTDENTGESFLYLENLSSTYTTGILKFVASGASVNKENAGALFTNTKSNTYFEIDLSAFEGLYVSITVKMSTNSDTAGRSLYINKDKSTSSGLKSVTSSNKTDYQTLEYGGVISAGETLYLTWSDNIRIFTIDIEIMNPDDVTSEVRDVTLDKASLSLYVEETEYLTATVEMTIGDFTGAYEWSSSNENVARVEGSGNGATVIAVGSGEATITVKAGDKEATCTVTVKEEGAKSQEESFVVSIAGSEEGLSSDSFSSGSAITDNSLFTVTADVNMKYYGGKQGSGGSNPNSLYGALQDGSNAVSFTDMNGTTHNPDQGIQVSSGITAGQTVENILTITAKENIQLYVYVSWANDGYSSNKSGTIFYSVDGGEKIENNLMQRKTIWTISVELSAGQTLMIGATNNESSDSAKLWFFGAEAKLLDGATGGGSSGGGTFEDLEGYEWVTFVADIESAYETTGAKDSSTKSQSAFTDGKFTFPSNMYYEPESSGISGSWDVNTQGNNSITVVLTGVYNNLSFVGRSDNTVTVGIYKSGSSDVIYEWTLGSTVSTCNYNTATGYYLEAGTYLITTSATARLAEITAYEYVEESNPAGIEAGAATVDFLYGRSISESDLGLIVTLVYENTRTEPVSSGYTTDLSSVMTTFQPGANTVTITYAFTDAGSGQSYDFSTTVTIYLYELEKIEISDFSMAYTGGTYYTNNVQKIYLVGDTVSYEYAAVTATASYGSGEDKVSTTFILTSSEVDFKTTDSDDNEVFGAFSAVDTYTVTATVDASLKLGSSVTESYEVNVVAREGADITQVNVNQDATLGMDSATGIYTVNTISDAVQLIKLLGAPDNVRKYIYVGAGQYWEKIYIDIPNLTLVGANSYDGTSLATRQDSTTGGTEIVYWAFNGLMDPSGTTTFSTVGSATVTVAKEAIGFCAANITFRNYWNTNALYLECKAMYNDTQADAAYINADKVYFYNVTFTGYHDTLEAENGRQYYDHCYIEGRTDYIFGNTATCYFSNCNIHTIGAGDSNNGGYVMAIKGTGVNYGYIFNGCDFTTDLETYYTGDDVDEDFKYTVEGTVSVARTWSGSDMHIAILNSTFDAGFSTEAYNASTGKGASGKNSRYTHMTSGQAPTPGYLIEYNNTGAGAISESIENTCTVYTNESDIQDYLDFTKIFADANGSVKYDDDWSGASVELVTVTVTANGNTYKVTGYKNSLTIADVIAAIKEEDATIEITVLYGEDNNPLDDSTKIGTDMTCSAETAAADMTVPSSVTYDFGADVTIEESGYFGYLDIQLGSGSFSYNGSGWFVLAGDATISVKLSAGSVISVHMYYTNALVVNGQDVSCEVEGNEGDCTYTYIAATDGETVTFSAASSGQLCIDKIAITVYVTYNIGDTISFISATGLNITGSVGEYAGIIVDATSGKLVDNNGSCCQIGNGLVLKIYSTPDATAVVYFYQGDGTYAADYTVETDDKGVITITITGPASTNTGGEGSMYITSIEIIEKTT
ncbi:MAG: pectinesterase family protein [Clostridia bacterium]|nr:pectinesterase family protein [Clostridia bacterium]